MIYFRFISNDEKAKELSKRAYTSYIKAYTTHPHLHHGIFHIRKLHLGHICKSFGMRDTVGENGQGRRKENRDSAEVVMKRKANLMASEEYGTSLGVYKKTKKASNIEEVEK